jgi:hypothetical protein
MKRWGRGFISKAKGYIFTSYSHIASESSLLLLES